MDVQRVNCILCDYQHLLRGIKGVRNLYDTAFGIKTIYTSKNFGHMVFSLSLKSGYSCTVSRDKQEGLLTTSQFQSKIEPSSFSMSCMWSLPKHAEIFTVVDRMQFQVWNNNATKTIQMVTDVHVNRYKKKLNVL